MHSCFVARNVECREAGGAQVEIKRTMPKVSVRLGNTKTSAEAYRTAKASPVFVPRKWACGQFACKARREGPSPTTTFEPGKSSSRKASIFFSGARRPA